MKRGFTLLELMVASLLMTILVVIMTMIFNQSSIAWETGVATVANLTDSRKIIAQKLAQADRTINAAKGLQIASVWSDEPNKILFENPQEKGRVLTLKNDRGGGQNSGYVEYIQGSYRMEDPLPDNKENVTKRNPPGGDTYVVGVESWGPDGERYTWDDISTYPESRR